MTIFTAPAPTAPRELFSTILDWCEATQASMDLRQLQAELNAASLDTPESIEGYVRLLLAEVDAELDAAVQEWRKELKPTGPADRELYQALMAKTPDKKRIEELELKSKAAWAVFYGGAKERMKPVRIREAAVRSACRVILTDSTAGAQAWATLEEWKRLLDKMVA